MSRILLLLLFAILCIQGPQSQACHIGGKAMYYRYVGDSTGISRQYEVTLVVYISQNYCLGNLSMEFPICVSSSCHSPEQNISLNMLPGYTGRGTPISHENPCVDEPIYDPDLVRYNKIVYSGLVELPRNCEDWVFSALMPCCRVNQVENYDVISEGGSALIEAHLNNTRGQNSSPYFKNNPVTAYCAGRQARLRNDFTELEGDSVRIKFEKITNSRGDNGGCRDSSRVVTEPSMSSAYETHQPFLTVPEASTVLNEQTGVVSFFASSMKGVFAVRMSLEEYRYDTISDHWFNIGKVSRDYLISAVACQNQTEYPEDLFDLFQPDFDVANVPTSVLEVFDPIKPLQLDSFPYANSPTGYGFSWPEMSRTCDDEFFELHFKHDFDMESISADGSNFFIISEEGEVYPVIGVQSVPAGVAQSRIIELETKTPLYKNGKYYLFFIGGTNGLSLTSICFDTIPRHTVLQINLSDCPETMQQSVYGILAPFAAFSPNPVEHAMWLDNLSTKFGLHCTFYDMRGARIQEIQLNKGERRQISTDHLAAGQYILRFQQAESGNTISQRFVKQ